MASVKEIMQLCRLCLVKDHVNVPIFEEHGDNRQISMKISTCLPVKVSKDDNLPKKVCDGCSCKLDMLYEFYNTSASSEKQLLEWLDQANVNQQSTTATDILIQYPHSIDEDLVKQEVIDIDETQANGDFAADDLNVPVDSNYLLQETFEFEQAATSSTARPSATVTSATVKAAPKRKRRAAASKPLPPQTNSEDEDDVDAVETKVAKTEYLSDDDNDNTKEEPETTFVGLPTDNEQPGPSGVEKADQLPSSSLVETQIIYECEICTRTFPKKAEFLSHHINDDGKTFNCCKCSELFETITDLNVHYELHKEIVVIEDDEEDAEFVCEDHMNIPNESTGVADELYILDESQCINEVVLEEDHELENTVTETTSSDSYTIEIEHGYMLPSALTDDDEDKSLSVSKATTKRYSTAAAFSNTAYVVLNPNHDIDATHYKCLRCEQLFINKLGFSAHIERAKCYINGCDICNASFKRNSEFYEHYLEEHADRAICNFCFRTFLCEKNVKEHMMRHLDKFRHRCSKCSKGFFTTREYRNHYRNKHMGIKHACEVCGRSFADIYYFRRHVATH